MPLDRVRRPPECSRRGSSCRAPRNSSASWSQVSGLDLAELGTTASAEEITDTAVTQPLVVAATLLAHAELTQRGLLAGAETVVAGHSVGEIAAYAIGGVISADDAVALAATRGAEMAKACAAEPTGMSAVLGGDEAEVLARLEELELVPANRNAAGQIVAAGRLDALAEAGREPAGEGAGAPAGHRRRLPHSLHGVGAGRLRRRCGRRSQTAEPTATLLSNADGQPVASAADAMAKLVAQLTRPVRWDLCTETLRQRRRHGDRRVPARGTLTGIAKRELRGIATHAVKTPADLDGLTELYRITARFAVPK